MTILIAPACNAGAIFIGETVGNRPSLQEGRHVRRSNDYHPIEQSFVERLHTYGKEERLKSRKRIDALFREGKRIHASPVMVIYRFHRDHPTPLLQAGVTVRARQFRLAVDRNRIKRLLREAYRLQKEPLREMVRQGAESLDLFILFTGKALPAYPDIFASTGEALRKIMERHAQGS